MKFPRGKANSRNNRGVRNKARVFQITYYKTENRITERCYDGGLQDKMARQMCQTRDTCLTAVPRKANTRTKPYTGAARAALGATVTRWK